MYSFSGNCAASVQFQHSCFCEQFIFFPSQFLYSQDWSTYFPACRIGRSIVGIYKSLTDTRIWKLGLWPRNSFSWNICFEFSVLVLCSVACYQPGQATGHVGWKVYVCFSVDTPRRTQPTNARIHVQMVTRTPLGYFLAQEKMSLSPELVWREPMRWRWQCFSSCAAPLPA